MWKFIPTDATCIAILLYFGYRERINFILFPMFDASSKILPMIHYWNIILERYICWDYQYRKF